MKRIFWQGKVHWWVPDPITQTFCGIRYRPEPAPDENYPDSTHKEVPDSAYTTCSNCIDGVMQLWDLATTGTIWHEQ